MRLTLRWFESNNGHGSIFHTAITMQTVPSASPEFHMGDMKSLKCAVVDKCSTFAQHLKLLLEKYGNRSSVFKNIEEVKEADCLFVDARFDLEQIQRVVKPHEHVVLMGYTAQPVKLPQDYFLLEKPLRESKLKQLLDQIQQNIGPCTERTFRKAEEVGDFKNLSILLAEDNEMNQQIITRMLMSLGFVNVKVVDNGLKAIEQVRSNHYDLIFMDIMVRSSMVCLNCRCPKWEE